MKRAARVLGLTVLALAMVTVRVVWSSRAEWNEAGRATGAERLSHLGRAARLYAPGNPFSRRALDALAETARAGGPPCSPPGVNQGRDASCADELAAWREVRSAILATRSFYTPRPQLLAEANARIATLMAEAEPRDGAPLSLHRAWHAARLATDDAPSVGWSVAALLGLAGWIGSAVGFFLRAVDERDRLRRRPAIGWALGVAFGLALFFVSLSRA